MNNVATAIGSMFFVSNGEAVATSPKVSQTKGKPGKHAFADTPPLARLRDEAKSHKKLDPRSDAADTEVGELGPKVREAETDSVGCGADVEGQQPKSGAGGNEPAKEEVVPVAAVAQPAEETMARAEVVHGEAEVDHASLTFEVEVSEGATPDGTGNATVSPGKREGEAVVQAERENGQIHVQQEAGTKTELVDGQTPADPMETTTSAVEQSAEGPNEVAAKNGVMANPPGAQDASPPEAANAEEPKATAPEPVEVAAKQQGSESTGTPSRVAAQNSEIPDAAKPAETETVAKSQTQVQPQVQVPAEDTKAVHADKTPVMTGEPQTSERSQDATRQDDAQTSSQQDSGARPQPQGPVQEIAASKPETETVAQTFKKPLQGETELTVVSQDGSAEASPRLSAQAVGATGLDAAVTKSPVQDVGQQILDSVHASMARADKQVQIRLDPPELGAVTVRITEQNDQIQGILQVSRDDTRREIEQALPQVLKGLQDAGIQVRRLEVVVSDQPERGLGRDELQQDAWAHQQQEQNPDQGHRPQNTASTNWSARAEFQQSRAGLNGLDGSDAQGPQDRIDMLM